MPTDEQNPPDESLERINAEIEAYAFESLREDIRIGEEQIRRGEVYTTEEVKEIFRKLRLKHKEKNNQKSE